ncbi:ankyrin repeat domain-containing protein [Aspergillus ibericus CBS 121593]|uniref:Ankyrin n=1 Tax=Aspergillus ibericus CBS 121593 TaxID=1448316 RepID=A0A395GU33_9EURO|nr:ankyrin [Aspergillus ibericus CBS 121593]RAK98939.1 ankyrin [Aspergillus ibericus CBS 121593]
MSLTLTPDTIDDLIYSARAGDLPTLESDLTTLSTQTSSTPALIIASAIDSLPAEEGGSGSSLLHYPAANGNIEILSYLLTHLTQLPAPTATKILNHRNYSGNTPLHWAALNTHLECVKALVEAGADVAIKNDAGLDAVFLAERADWNTRAEGEGDKDGEGDEEVEVEIGGDAEEGAEGAGEMTRGRQVVEWLLSSEKGGELESGVGEGKE